MGPGRGREARKNSRALNITPTATLSEGRKQHPRIKKKSLEFTTVDWDSSIVVHQHEPMQCYAACITTTIRQYCRASSLDVSVSLSDINQIISAGPNVPVDIPHADNVADKLNTQLLSNTPLQFRERSSVGLSKLKELLENKNTSHPIVALHSDYYTWQPSINTDNLAVSKHAVVVREINDNHIQIWDPESHNHSTYKTKIPEADFLEYWERTVDVGKLGPSPMPKEGMWVIESEIEAGQQRL